MTIVLRQPIKADVLALDTDQAIEYLLDHLHQAKLLAHDIIRYAGNLCWATVELHPKVKGAILVNGEWCENVYCALAYLLAAY